VIAMKTAVLHTEGIEFAPWGIAIVKALLLAKFMLVGRALKIGEGNTTRPLVWPTLYRAFAFLVLLVILTIIEEAVVGLFHDRSRHRSAILSAAGWRKPWRATSSCCSCWFRISLSASWARCSARGG
jgi:hypothetical protein